MQRPAANAALGEATMRPSSAHKRSLWFAVLLLMSIGSTAGGQTPSAPPPTSRYSVAKIVVGMKEPEVLSLLEGSYDIHELKSHPANGKLLWATDKKHPKGPTLTIYLDNGQVWWVKKQWFDEAQPSSAAAVLQAQYDIIQDLLAENENLSCSPSAVLEASKSGLQSFQAEIRCGDVQIETIRDTEKGKEVAVQVNEVLLPADQRRRPNCRDTDCP